MFMITGGVLSIFERDRTILPGSVRWICISVIIGLISTPAMLLSATNAGSHRVEGLQGRYFLPLVPIFYYVVTKFSLHTPDKSNYEQIQRKGMICLSGLSCISVYYILAIYLTRWCWVFKRSLRYGCWTQCVGRQISVAVAVSLNIRH